MKKGIGPRGLGVSPLKQTMTEKSKKYYPEKESKWEQIGRSKDGKETAYRNKELGKNNITTGPPMEQGEMGPGFGSDPNFRVNYNKGAESWVYDNNTGRIGAMTRKTVDKGLGLSEEYYDVEWDRRPKGGKLELPRKKGRILKK
jgi:hypothetical protein